MTGLPTWNNHTAVAPIRHEREIERCIALGPGELTQTIRDVAPKEVWITHGREDALMHWCQLHQIKARELNLVGYEDEDG